MSNKKLTHHQHEILSRLYMRDILLERNGMFSWDSLSPTTVLPKVSSRTFNILLKNKWIEKGVKINTDHTNYHLSGEGIYVIETEPYEVPKERPLTHPQLKALVPFMMGFSLRCTNGRFGWRASGRGHDLISDQVSVWMNTIADVPCLSTLKRLIRDDYLKCLGYEYILLSEDNIVVATERGLGVDVEPLVDNSESPYIYVAEHWVTDDTEEELVRVQELMTFAKCLNISPHSIMLSDVIYASNVLKNKDEWDLAIDDEKKKKIQAVLEWGEWDLKG